MRTLVALALVLLAAAPLAGEAPDPAVQEALAASPRAAAIDTEVRAMTGSPQLTQEFYDLAATIFEELAKSSGGDPNTMRETLERAAEDPAAFAALLSPATLDRLRALAVKISDRPR